MKSFSRKYWLEIIGGVLGGIGGYAYYHFVGCSNGSCAITSKPLNSTLYGIFIGILLFSSFKDQSKKE